MKVTIIIGLPGSGKSYLINRIAKQHTILDDFVSPDKIHMALSLGNDVIMADPYFCEKDILAKAVKIVEVYTSNIEYIYFENNKERAIANAENRGRGVKGLIHQLSAIYKPPENARKIFQKNDLSLQLN